MLLVFKHRSEGTMENMVRFLSGAFLHVDMIPCLNEPYAYTSYMFEPFSKNASLDAYDPASYTARYIPLSEPERRSAVEFLEECAAKRVPYNYADLPCCVFMPSRLVSDYCKDAPVPSSLFCSQAAVLCLRHAVDPDSPLGAALAKLNSRTTSPNALFTALSAFAIPVPVMRDFSQLDVPTGLSDIPIALDVDGGHGDGDAISPPAPASGEGDGEEGTDRGLPKAV